MTDDKPKKPAQGKTHHYTEEDLLRDQFEKQKQAEKSSGGSGKAGGKTPQNDNNKQ